MDVAKLDIRVDSSSVTKASTSITGMGAASSGAMSKVKLLSGALIAMGAGTVLTKIIQNTNEFTKSISELSAITGATGKDLAFYEEQAALIGKTTTLSASQAATAFKLIASAKPDLLASKEALAAVTKEAVTLAEAAGVDLAAAAQTVGVSLNQFGAEADQASRFVNVLAAGAKMGSSSITDTSAAMKNAGVAAKLAGLSFEEANVGVQLLAKGGLFAAEAGTGFRQVLLKLENEAEDKFKPSIVGLAGALENLAEENMSLTDLTGLFGAEAMKSAAVMIAGAKDARTLEKAITGTSIATEMAATNFDNMEGDMLSLNSANEGLAITFGKKLEPMIRKSLKAATDFSRKLDNFVKSEKFTKLIKTMTSVLKVFSAVLATKVVTSVLLTSKAFLTTAKSAGIASTATKLFGVALKVAGGPIGVAVLAITGLYQILKNVFGIDFETYTRYFKAIGIVTKDALTSIKESWDKLAKFIADKFKAVFEYLTQIFTPLINFYKEAIEKIWGFYKAFFTALLNGAANAVAKFIGFFKDGFINVDKFIALTKTNIVAFYETMKTKASSFFDSEETTAKKLAEINAAKAASIAAVTQEFEAQKAAQSAIIVETGFLDTAFTTLQTTAGNVATAFTDFTTDVHETAKALKPLVTTTEEWDKAAVAATTSVGVLRTGIVNTKDSSVDLVTEWNLMAKPQGTFSVVTQAMQDAGGAASDTSDNIDDVGASSVTAAGEVGQLTTAQMTFKTQVENTQTAFATLIKDTITSGKMNFSSFFETVKEGWKTMIAELMAKKLMDAIFGNGGVSGFLSSLSSGFSGIMSSISSGLGGIVSLFSGAISSLVSSLASFVTGGGSAATNAVTSAASSAGGSVAASSATGTAATGGGLGTAMSTGVAAIGQFAAGLTGTAVGTGAVTAGGVAIAGPPTAAAAAGAGLSASLAAGASNVWAFMTNPITMAIAAIAIAAKLLDPSGTMSHNAGMLTGDFETDPSRKFNIDPFASGAQFYGMNRRASVEQAEGVVAGFRAIDASLSEAARGAGLSVNLSASDFIGTNEKGKGTGAFFGSAFEEGGSKGKSLEEQYTTFTKRWLTLVAGENGTDPAVLNNLLSLGSSQEILAAIDGSHASGIDRVPYDNYIAQLHEGERVQSVQEAQRTDLMAAEMFNLRGNLNDLMLVVAKAVNKTARIESRWDVNGLPPTRS